MTNNFNSPISFLRRHRGTGSDEPTATAFAGYCGRGEDLGIVVGGPLAQVCEAVWAPESPLGRPGTRRSNTASLTFQPIALDCCYNVYDLLVRGSYADRCELFWLTTVAFPSA